MLMSIYVVVKKLPLVQFFSNQFIFFLPSPHLTSPTLSPETKETGLKKLTSLKKIKLNHKIYIYIIYGVWLKRAWHTYSKGHAYIGLSSPIAVRWLCHADES